MTCRACMTARHIALNLAVALDRLSNSLLLGSPNETMSQRMARARASGHHWATIACAILTWVGRTVFGQTEDHCTWSLEPGTSAVEIWHWSPPVSAAEHLAPSSSD